MDLKDEQWSVIEALLPKKKQRIDGKGRPRADQREVMNGILWILRTGAQWRDLPERYPPYQTVHRWFQTWVDSGVIESILNALAQDLFDRGKLDLSETYLDGSFASAKKGALMLVKQSAAKGPRSWQLQTATVFLSPLGLRALHRMRLLSSKTQSKTASPKKYPKE